MPPPHLGTPNPAAGAWEPPRVFVAGVTADADVSQLENCSSRGLDTDSGPTAGWEVIHTSP